MEPMCGAEDAAYGEGATRARGADAWHSGAAHEEFGCLDRSIVGMAMGMCRRFDPGGSLDRRVNCRCVSQPRWVGERQNTRGSNKGNRGLVLSCAQGGCTCSRVLQAFAREREREPVRQPVLPCVHLLVRGPWTFLL
jgi:hypothetical protein